MLPYGLLHDVWWGPLWFGVVGAGIWHAPLWLGAVGRRLGAVVLCSWAMVLWGFVTLFMYPNFLRSWGLEFGPELFGNSYSNLYILFYQ